MRALVWRVSAALSILTMLAFTTAAQFSDPAGAALPKTTSTTNKHYGPHCHVVLQILIGDVDAGLTVNVLVTDDQGPDAFRILLFSSPIQLGTLTTGRSVGGVSVGTGSFVVPASVPTGTHTMQAIDAQGCTASLTVLIDKDGSGTASPSAGSGSGTGSTGSGHLGFTGAEVAGTLGAAAAAVFVGGVLVLASRRRRHSQSAA